MTRKKIKVALVYDKVNTRYGGAEWVLLSLKKAFPTAPLYTTLYEPSKTPWAKHFTIFSSFLQKLPLKNHKLLVWLFPLAFESFDLSEYDVVISITSGEAKGVLTKPTQLHLCYMLTPPRYLYTHTNIYLKHTFLLQLPGISWLSKKALRYLRWWDTAAAQRPDKIIAISKLVQHRISQIYNRKSSVIYPPIPVEILPTRNKSFKIKQPFLLSLSRLVKYKRIDISIKAALATNTPLIIAGAGEEKNALIKVAGNQAAVRTTEKVLPFIQKQIQTKKIIFVGHVTNTERLQLLVSAKAVLMPGIEDFGITALEAAYLGTPPLIHQKSGVAEVLPKYSGSIHIKEETTTAVQEGIQELFATQFKKATLQNHAKTCSTKVFTRKIKEYVYDSIIHIEKN